MEKRKLSRIMARAGADEVRALARLVEEKHGVTVLKEPARTLVMLPVREPARGTVFYLGELIATEAMAEIEGARGIGICMGAEDEKALAMAVVDAAFNARIGECGELSALLNGMEEKQSHALAREAALHAKTRVSFETLEGQ
jgi:alpha-D-ribose 1-methylphosphonate 5-triphosphate synthase subunit PhnG